MAGAAGCGRLGPLAMPVGVTLGAQVGVALPSLLVFGRLPLVGIVANLLAVPVAGLVMLYGLPACLLAGAGPGARAGRRWRPSAGASGGSTPWPPSAQPLEPDRAVVVARLVVLVVAVARRAVGVVAQADARMTPR